MNKRVKVNVGTLDEMGPGTDSSAGKRYEKGI